MKTLLPYLSALFISFSGFLSAQTCPDGDLWLISQGSINNFSTNYPGCTVIEGDLIIQDYTGDQIKNLSGLATITTIKGNLSIGPTYFLTTLDGLQGLDTVYGDISIGSNAGLLQITGLNDIKYIGGTLTIGWNSELKEINPFTSLNHLGGLSLYWNSRLNSFQGFDQLETIDGSVSISENSSLLNVEGFENIDSINGSLGIGPTKFQNLAAFSNFQFIRDDLVIGSNNYLSDLSGFNNLKTINGKISIWSNDSLTSIDELHNIEVDSVDGLQIVGNQLLSVCNTPFICSLLNTLPTLADINGNGPGCNSYLQLYEQCGLTHDCPPGLYFKTQDEVNKFPTFFPECNMIEGDLIIYGDKITNLDSLSQITHIEGTLEIRSTAVKDLTSFQNLTYIGNDLQIQWNDSLQDLSGLENITLVNGHLHIYGNQNLLNLTGLQNLTVVNGYISIVGNDSLINLQGLSSLQKTGDDLNISGNNFQSLEGVFNLDSIGGELNISYNESLVNLSGMESTRYIGSLVLNSDPSMTSLQGLSPGLMIRENIIIDNNDQLVDLSALESIQAINGDLKITGNDVLNDLTGLSALTTIGDHFYVTSNPSIENLDGLTQLEFIGGDIKITSNVLLSQLNGLHNIDKVYGSLNISSNPLLSQLNGLGNISSIDGALTIKDNGLLENLNSLLSLRKVGGNFLLEKNSLLTTFGQIPVDSIMGHFIIRENPLTTFDNLDNLTIIGGRLEVIDNDQLVSFEGLTQLEKTGGMMITGNALLNNIDVLTTLNSINGEVEFSNNPKLTRLATFDKVLTINGDVLFSSNALLTGLWGLDSVRMINGKLSLSSTAFINLGGLNSLTSIGRDLEIYFNSKLETLDGLDNLNSINGTLRITRNDKLSNIEGISNLDPDGIRSHYSIIEDILIYLNPLLSDCSVTPICNKLIDRNTTYLIKDNKAGCDSWFQILANCDLSNACGMDSIVFTSQNEIDNFKVNYPECSFIQCDVTIREDVPGNIVNLHGLEGLKLIGGTLKIYRNQELHDLIGLDSLYAIGGFIYIQSNNSLSDLSGLDNIDGALVNTNLFKFTSLIIRDNPDLTMCSVNPVCELLTTPNVNYVISGNSSSCNTKNNIIDGCGFSAECPDQDFETQKDIDEFPIRYPKCTTMAGELHIQDWASTPSLEIINLQPLSQLTKINGPLTIRYTDELITLDGLENITEINGSLVIERNVKLIDIQGIRNIDPLSIKLEREHLEISRNALLNECAVENICQLLELEGIETTIYGNGPKCESDSAIRAECLVSLIDLAERKDFKIYPNPSTGLFKIETDKKEEIISITIHDMTGTAIRVLPFRNEIYLNEYPAGMYTIILHTRNNKFYSKRIVLVK